jgi:hypothetical protein
MALRTRGSKSLLSLTIRSAALVFSQAWYSVARYSKIRISERICLRNEASGSCRESREGLVKKAADPSPAFDTLSLLCTFTKECNQCEQLLSGALKLDNFSIWTWIQLA